MIILHSIVVIWLTITIFNFNKAFLKTNRELDSDDMLYNFFVKGYVFMNLLSIAFLILNLIMEYMILWA